jgi:hypothetical protein
VVLPITSVVVWREEGWGGGREGGESDGVRLDGVGSGFKRRKREERRRREGGK